MAGPALQVVVASTVPSSTAATYAALRPEEMGDDGRSARLAEVLQAGGALDSSLLGSALERAACRADPVLGVALQRAREVIPGIEWHLTGSGGAVFALTPTRTRSEEIASSMRNAGFNARACRTVG